MRTKLFAVSLLALSCLSASGKSVYFFQGDAAEPFKSIADVSKITFSASGVELTDSKSRVSVVAFADFSAFAFAEKRTVGVSASAGESYGIRVVNGDAGFVGVESREAIAAVTVYSTSGSVVAEFRPGASSFGFTIAEPGLYLVKVSAGTNQVVTKILKR